MPTPPTNLVLRCVRKRIYAKCFVFVDLIVYQQVYLSIMCLLPRSCFFAGALLAMCWICVELNTQLACDGASVDAQQPITLQGLWLCCAPCASMVPSWCVCVLHRSASIQGISVPQQGSSGYSQEFAYALGEVWLGVQATAQFSMARVSCRCHCSTSTYAYTKQ